MRLSAHLANEFLCKKDYRQELAHRGARGVRRLTLDGWRALLERSGFVVRKLEAYANEWIRENRYQDHVKLTEPDGSAFWPATNAVIVGEKR